MPFDAALTAWATLGLAVFAVVTAWYARRAFLEQESQVTEIRKQVKDQETLNEKQLPVLEGQQAELQAAREERERGAKERREAYVRRVFIWQEGRLDTAVLSQAQLTTGAMPGQDSVIKVRNSSEVPAYDVTLVWWINGSMVNLEKLATPVMPGPEGAQGTWRITLGADPTTIEITGFMRDANGNRWRIKPDGRYEPYEDSMLPSGARLED